MSTNIDKYNGWTNRETWLVKLWINNDQSTQEYWREAAGDAWEMSQPCSPNEFILTREGNAQSMLAQRLRDEYDSESEHPVFAAADGSVYTDLLNAALSEVDWHGIAASLLEEAELEGYEPHKGNR